MKASALLRGIIDLLLLVVFIVIGITGIGLYLAPSGRIAESIGWTFLGFDKDTLTEVHTYFGFVMIGLVALHLLIGFKSMVTMLRMGLRKSKLKGMAALVIPLLLVVAGYQVFTYYTGEEESESHEVEVGGDATVYITGVMMKYYTVRELAESYNVSVEALIEELAKRGIEASPDEKLAEIEYKYELDREEFKAILEEIITHLRGGER
ncbi:hypothetical protein PNA2_0558 [Pyrococcus sp. NA2]|uniref:translation initiation factor IF-2 N-terminal domain-containing protein n=1 Tax=Pyrococcus sp. (strain NA2) TaxID=342949 RepID=UPI000209ABAC|nr:translation initiation factor IF-2 N-terminal domain-containing protein [Pyrococcus sp. NA2]AEC51475.1 hypothetical protein PNA2_0558 [Pyrococcus sp. NA2]